MQLTLSQLRALVALKRYGSFTAAADAMGRTQPAVTAQVKQLEEFLGIKLVDRTTRRLRLTSTGVDLVPEFARILQDLDDVVEASRRLRRKVAGTVRIACIPSVAVNFLPRSIAAFRERFPMIAFSVNDTIGERVVELVKQAKVEFGITDVTPGTADLEVIPLINDTIRAFFLAGHPIELTQRVDAEELCRHDLILSEPGTNVRRIVDAAFAATGRHAFAACEVAHNITAVGLVRAGLGVALLPPTYVEEGLDMRIRSRELQGPGFERQIGIVKLRNRTLAPAAKAFMQDLERRAP